MGACLSSPKGLNVVPTIAENVASTDEQHKAIPPSSAAKDVGDGDKVISKVKGTFKRRKSVSSEPGKQSAVAFKVIPKDPATKARLRDIISRNPILKELDDAQKTRIIDAMFERKVKKNEVIIQEGEEGDNFYVIDHGSFTATIQDTPKMVYNNKGSFGELALMYNCARAATVTSTTEGILWALDRGTFRALVVAAAAQRRKRNEQFLKSVKLLKDLSPEQRAAIADCLSAEFYKPGEVIIREGDEPNDESKFYILEAGRVDCFRKIQGIRKLTKSLAPGDVFGEVALLTDEPRQADCIASTHVQCLAMCRAAFERLMGPAESSLSKQVEEYRKYNSTNMTLYSSGSGGSTCCGNCKSVSPSTINNKNTPAAASNGRALTPSSLSDIPKQQQQQQQQQQANIAVGFTSPATTTFEAVNPSSEEDAAGMVLQEGGQIHTSEERTGDGALHEAQDSPGGISATLVQQAQQNQDRLQKELAPISTSKAKAKTAQFDTPEKKGLGSKGGIKSFKVESPSWRSEIGL